MAKNPGGVTHMTVVNPGRPPHRNPLQWVSKGRGSKSRSPMFESAKAARAWGRKNSTSSSGLFVVDQRGRALSEPLRANGVGGEMAYNLSQLRRAMRSNAVAKPSGSKKKPAGSKPAAGFAAVSRTAAGGLKVTATGAKASGSKKASRKSAGLTSLMGGAAKARKAASRKPKASKPKAAAKPKTGRKAASRKPKAAAKPKTSRKAGSKPKAVRRVAGLSFRSSYHMYGAPSVSAMAANRRGSRRRGSRRMRPNVLVPGGKQVVLYRQGSKRGETIVVPSLTLEHAYQRDFKFGGVAEQAHKARGKGWRKQLIGYLQSAEGANRKPGTSKKKGSKPAAKKKTSKKAAVAVAANRRHSMGRRHSRKRTSKNPLYTIMSNKRRKHGRRHGVRRNFSVYGRDLVQDVVMPAGVATGGFLIANALSNAVASNEGMRNLLDRGRDADQALATKSVANGVGILATLGVAAWGAKSGNKLISDNATPLLTGMGLSFIARLLRGTDLSPYLGQTYYAAAGVGEYIEQPMNGFGAYVNDPSAGIGDATYYATAGLGTYAEGIDPADQASVDGLMDVMEAAAGSPILEAAAGVGEYIEQPMNGVGEYIEQPMSGLGDATYYATAGLGAEADADLQRWYQKHQPPFVSTQTPTDMAAAVTKEVPYNRPIPTSLVTPEGKGYAGGLFARSLFAGMF